MRRFVLYRSKDKSGVSGEGVVAEGIKFDSGTCVVSWISYINSIGVYPSVDALIKVHGHGKSTEICYLDPEDWDQNAKDCWPFKET